MSPHVNVPIIELPKVFRKLNIKVPQAQLPYWEGTGQLHSLPHIAKDSPSHEVGLFPPRSAGPPFL